ncbi:MAG: hypothetical protein IPL10_15970 [Bacteroidetes bacterium]|nr:hypothetical protein [Bacteroidota bacterium]
MSEKDKQLLFGALGIFFLVIGFAVYVYRSYKDKQKANEAITKQKEVIEEKQRKF